MNSASLKKTIAEERMYKATFKELILSVYTSEERVEDKEEMEFEQKPHLHIDNLLLSQIGFYGPCFILETEKLF